MKRLRIILPLLLTLVAVNAVASNKMWIEPFSIEPGETKELKVYGRIDQPICAYQTRIMLPEGLEFVKTGGKYATPYNGDGVSVSWEVFRSEITVSDITSTDIDDVGALLVAAALVGKNATYQTGKTYCLYTIKVKASSSFSGDGVIHMYDMKYINQGGGSFEVDDLDVRIGNQVDKTITFSYDPEETSAWEPMTVHVTAYQGGEVFTGPIYYSIDTSSAGEQVYDSSRGIYLDSSCNLNVWAFDDDGKRYDDYRMYDIMLNITVGNILFSYDLSQEETYFRPMTLHITATEGTGPFAGEIYYSLTGDITPANASVYNSEVGIPISEPTTLAVWAFDAAGIQCEDYPHFEVYDYGPAWFELAIDNPAGTYYGRKGVSGWASGDNAFLREGTWKVLFTDGTSTEGEFENDGFNVVMDKSGKLMLDYTYWDENYQESHNVKDTLEYTILPPLKITFDPAAGKYSGTQNVYVGFEVMDPNSYFGFNSRSWTMYYDDGTIYTGNFDDNETVEVHGSGSLQVEANCYDEVGNITYADSARYEILQPTLTVIPEPGTYYGELTPKVVVENIDYEYEVRYSIRYDDGDIEAPNYNPWNDGVTAVKKSGMLYVMVIWYDETGMQHYLSKDRLHYTIMPEVQNDINQDGQMDVSDVVVLSSLVMGEGVNYYNKNMADVNGDGEVNVTDVVALANKTMGE